MARLVHRLRREEQLHFKEVLIHLAHPARGCVGGNKFDLGQEGAELAHRAFEIVGERLEFVPRDVAGGAPLARDRLLVQFHRIVGPAFGFVIDSEAERGHFGGNHGAARRHRAMVSAAIGDDAIAADFDIFQAEAEIARLGAHAPFAVLAHPGKIGCAGLIKLAKILRGFELNGRGRADAVFVFDLNGGHGGFLQSEE